jgi:hypothetical protein
MRLTNNNWPLCAVVEFIGSPNEVSSPVAVVCGNRASLLIALLSTGQFFKKVREFQF